MIHKKTIETCIWKHRQNGTYLAKKNQERRVSADNLEWIRNIHSAYYSDNIPPYILKIADRIDVTITTEIEIKDNLEINNG